MKIGFLVDKVSFGGGERLLKMLIDDFYKLHHKIILYTWNKDWLRICCPEYDIRVMENPPVRFWGKWKALFSLRDNLNCTKPDCLIVFSLGLAEVAVWAALWAKIPIILSERVDPHFLPQSKFHRFFKKIVYKNCSGLVFQTQVVKYFFSKSIQQKSIVIPNPILDDNLPIIADSICKKEVVTVGRLSTEKNFEMLVYAFAEAKLTGYKLRIFGEGPLYSSLSSLITSLDMCDSIILEGKVDRVIDYIQHSDIFVMTSNHEGMPNALIEGMAMGLACVSTDFPSGAARVLISDNKNGIIIPVNDRLALKEALQKLVSDQSFKQHIKSNAIKIRETNSKDIILPKWIDFIQSVVYK